MAQSNTEEVRLIETLRASAADLRGGVISSDLRTIATSIERAALFLEHEADAAEVRVFATLMTIKLLKVQEQGRLGWRDVPVAHLWAMLREQVEKGDPVDIANFAMMIQHHVDAAGQSRPPEADVGPAEA